MAMSGCQDLYLPTTPTRNPTGISESRTSTPTKIFPTFTIDPTSTETPKPTDTSTHSPTNTLQHSLTPIPTISSYHEMIDLISITGDDDCKLPCWAGITPGVTSWEEALNIIHSIDHLIKVSLDEGIENSPTGTENLISLYFYSDSPYESVRIMGSIGAQTIDGLMIVDSIRTVIDNYAPSQGYYPSVGLHLPDRLTLKEFLRDYGLTDLVYLGTELGGPEFPNVGIGIFLAYPDHHLLIEYHRSAKVIGDYMFACEPESLVVLNIIDNKESLLSKESISEDPHIGHEYFYRLDTFQNVVDIPIDVYFDDFINSESDCLTFPIDAWRYMLGE